MCFFTPGLKILVCLLVTMVLSVDYFLRGILNYKSHCAAGGESRNHVDNKQINQQGHLIRKEPHSPHVQQSGFVEIILRTFLRWVYLWKVPGDEEEL